MLLVFCLLFGRNVSCFHVERHKDGINLCTVVSAMFSVPCFWAQDCLSHAFIVNLSSGQLVHTSIALILDRKSR